MSGVIDAVLGLLSVHYGWLVSGVLGSVPGLASVYCGWYLVL